jgi:hypothetical protein
MPLIKFELKYCERCGSLRLRRADSDDTYCQPCIQLLDSFSVGSLQGLPTTFPNSPQAILQADTTHALAFGRLQ